MFVGSILDLCWNDCCFRKTRIDVESLDSSEVEEECPRPIHHDIQKKRTESEVRTIDEGQEEKRRIVNRKNTF